jgi:hypothetical protein
MATAHRTYVVEPGSELDRLLDEANDASVAVVRGGARFWLVRDQTDEAPAGRGPWAEYDPEKAREGMETAAGSWADLDTEQMIEDIYRRREEGSRPSDRP